VTYLLAEEVIAARNPVSLRSAGLGDDLPDLLSKLRRAALVRVEDEYPASLGPGDRWLRAAPIVVNRDLSRRPGGTGAIDGVIQRIVLDDDDLASPFDARNARFYVRGFIVSRDHRRYVGGAAVGGTHP
jgi:hypothetical protein